MRTRIYNIEYIFLYNDNMAIVKTLVYARYRIVLLSADCIWADTSATDESKPNLSALQNTNTFILSSDKTTEPEEGSGRDRSTKCIFNRTPPYEWQSPLHLSDCTYLFYYTQFRKLHAFFFIVHIFVYIIYQTNRASRIGPYEIWAPMYNHYAKFSLIISISKRE